MKRIDKLFDLCPGNGNFELPEQESLYRNLVQKSAKHLQAHESMVAMGLLGALSCAAQGAYDVQRPSREQNLPVSLYLLTIADPSERKTSVENYFFDPIRAFERKQMDQYFKEFSNHNSAHTLWRLEKKEIEKAYAKALKNGEAEEAGKYKEMLLDLLNGEPQPPVKPRFIYDDTTPEALLENMHRHRPLACLVTSEANSVLNGRALTALHHINNLWGKSGAIVDRTSKPSFSLDQNARLTLALMTQRAVVEHFVDSKGEKAKGTGFLSRMLVCTPPRLSGTRSYSLDDEVQQPEEFKIFKKRISKIFSQSEAAWRLSNDQTQPKPEVLVFNESAKKQWREYAKQVEEIQNVDGIYYFAPDHAGKIMENTTRVAALIHLLEGCEGQISIETLEAAFNLVLQLSENYMGYFVPQPSSIRAVDRLVQYVLKTGVVDGSNHEFIINRDDVLRKGPAELRKASALNKAVRILDKMKHIRWHDNKGSSYLLSLLPHNTPEIKNGYGFLLEGLPPYQRLRRLDGIASSQLASYEQPKPPYFLLSDDEECRSKDLHAINQCQARTKELKNLRMPDNKREFMEISANLDKWRQYMHSRNDKNVQDWIKEFTGNL